MTVSGDAQRDRRPDLRQEDYDATARALYGKPPPFFGHRDPWVGWPVLSWLCWTLCLGILLGWWLT